MANRGRPRHPDILTPREWEVLELLRSGASNAQIAERLSITERTVKFHVSEILSKLGVGSREEAARIALPERRRWWAAWPLWARIAGAATMAAAAAGLALLAWGVVRTGGPTDAQQPPSAPKQGLILTSAENPVPWTDLPASSNARPFTIPGVPPCQAANLIFDLLSAGTYNNGAERSWWDVMVRNKRGPCFVGPTLDATFANSGGALLVSPERVGSHIIYLENGPQYPGISNPAEGFTYSARGRIETSHSSPCTTAVTQLQVSAGPSLGGVDLKPNAATGWGTCVGEMYRSELHPEGTGGGSGGYSVQTELDAPAFAHVGERMRFLITVLNERPVTSKIPGTEDPPPETLDWSRCPTYQEELEGVSGSFTTHRLNCEPVNPMPPYASATFEMYIDVPADAQPGPSVLSFGFDDTAYQETSINVWIEP